ncbi:MAG: hypothetical protein FD153_1161 [Rhodospirillaceae bacterium]|nr:MAG: hypothetical protein FD153_1161 [Rhodospirillaceae bacterium]
MARLRSAGVMIAVAAMSGCVGDMSSANMACPRVVLDRTTSNLVQFRTGVGRDLTDIALEAEIIGYRGTCYYNQYEIILILAVDFAVTRGPAFMGAPWPYFVAVLQTLPPPVAIRTDPENGQRVLASRPALPLSAPTVVAKEVFQMTGTFPPRLDTIRVRDEVITLTLPLRQTESPERYQIFVGFQLTPEQLDDNRQNSQR